MPDDRGNWGPPAPGDWGAIRVMLENMATQRREDMTRFDAQRREDLMRANAQRQEIIEKMEDLQMDMRNIERIVSDRSMTRAEIDGIKTKLGEVYQPVVGGPNQAGFDKRIADLEKKEAWIMGGLGVVGALWFAASAYLFAPIAKKLGFG